MTKCLFLKKHCTTYKIIVKTYEVFRTTVYRLYPTASQKELLAKHFGCCRWIWNWALALRLEAWTKRKENISRYEISAMLPSLKKAEATEWLSEVNAQTLQATLVNLDMGYTRFFRDKKGFPKFKAKRHRESFCVPQHGTVGDTYVKIPKLGKIKAVIHRVLNGRIVKVTITRTPTGKFFAGILVETPDSTPAKEIPNDTNTIGIDLGLKHFAILSTGEKIENPRYLKWRLRKIKRVQRAFSRKKKGSNNQDRCRRKLARIHEQVANQRKDFHHKLSRRLLRENQAIALETLNVLGMYKNRHIAQSLKDASWASFVRIMEYKAEQYGKTILRIGRFDPSSKRCSCGLVNVKLTASDRSWTCESCHILHDRDILAANNIKSFALNPKQLLRSDRPESTLGEIAL